MNEPSTDIPVVPAANGQKKLRPITRRRQLPASGMITVEAGKIRLAEIDPAGKRLFVANQESGNIVEFRIDAKRGRLTEGHEVLKVPAPVCIKFVAAE